MRPGIVGPDELKLLDCLLQKASVELRYEPGSEEHQELASLKDPDELLAAGIRSVRFGRF